eukprot:5827699-Amphidinium_carterae.2
MGNSSRSVSSQDSHGIFLEIVVCAIGHCARSSAQPGGRQSMPSSTCLWDLQDRQHKPSTTHQHVTASSGVQHWELLMGARSDNQTLHFLSTIWRQILSRRM